MDVLAVWVGKLTLLSLRLVGRRGNALPGLVVEKFFPGYLPRAMARLPKGVVIVSGTNGKTTTTKMVATILSAQLRVLTNDSGSNFVRGTITTAVERSRWTGRLNYDVAVFELDEAWAVRFAAVVAPSRTLLLNVMRDQLDRFGEIDVTAKLLGQVAAATTTALVLNRDDPRIAALAADAAPAAVVSYYGVAPELRSQFPNDEELYGGPLSQSQLAATAELLELATPGQPQTALRIGVREVRVTLRAGGPHNAQNAAGAAAMALTFGLSPEQVEEGLRRVEPAFGRGQAFTVDGRTLVLQLVKNPAGFRQSLKTLDTAHPKAIVIAINDEYADGRDVSWLWDVDFAGALSAPEIRPARISTSGVRAADMALRLHYDEIEVSAIVADLETAVREAVAGVRPSEEVIVFATYTAMWALHAILLRIGAPVS
jgi:lipid II isoglutaminyl synthase (glutamine-hydrolysing)